MDILREKELQQVIKQIRHEKDAISMAYDSLLAVQKTKVLELANLRQKVKKLEAENLQLLKKK